MLEFPMKRTSRGLGAMICLEEEVRTSAVYYISNHMDFYGIKSNETRNWTCLWKIIPNYGWRPKHTAYPSKHLLASNLQRSETCGVFLKLGVRCAWSVGCLLLCWMLVQQVG